MNISNEVVPNLQTVRGVYPASVDVFRQGAVGIVRTSGICTRRTDHGFEADVPAILCVGEEVEAELLLPEASELVRVSARVIYRNQNHYGFFYRSTPHRRHESGIAEIPVTQMIQ